MNALKQSDFDVIVVGAGSAGATLAARLSEQTDLQVCLLEAGGKDKNPLIHIPFGISLLTRFTDLGWNYETAPQQEMNNRQMFWPRGKTLGGSSSVNAMCYIRGVKEDYDKWQALGADGWDWDSVLPYFKKAEGHQHGEDKHHGANGPLKVSDLRHTNPLSHSFIRAAQQVGESFVADFNGDDRNGVGFYQVTQINGQRCSSAKGYLSAAKDRENLTLVTRAQVEQVIIEQGAARGVRVRVKGEAVSLRARKEVILCGGAINSPQLLMLSGVGPKEHLQEQGIEVKHDLPGVGQNLQDHLDAIVQFRSQAPKGYAIDMRALPMYVKGGFNYLFKRNDVFSSNVAEAGGFARTCLADEMNNGLADIQYHFLPAILQDHGRSTVFGYGFGLHVCCLYPKSRGEIRLRCSDPLAPAMIDPKYLSHEDDQKVMVEAVKKAREILNATEFLQYQPTEMSPGQGVKSDQDILAFIRAQAETIYHPVGTCKMGQEDDPMAVVDSRLKVRGITGLRVVDASVMPTLIGGNTNAPTIMIAEKAADLIKLEYKVLAVS